MKSACIHFLYKEHYSHSGMSGASIYGFNIPTVSYCILTYICHASYDPRITMWKNIMPNFTQVAHTACLVLSSRVHWPTLEWILLSGLPFPFCSTRIGSRFVLMTHFSYITPAGVQALNYEFSPWTTKHLLHTHHNRRGEEKCWAQRLLKYISSKIRICALWFKAVFFIISMLGKLYKMENGAK